MPRSERTSQREPERFVSLGVRIAIATCAVVVLVGVFVSVQLTRHERNNIVSAKRIAADMVGDLIAVNLVAPLDFEDTEGIDTELTNLRSNRDVLYAAVYLGEREIPLAVLGQPDGYAPDAATIGRPTTYVLSDRIEVLRPVLRADGHRLGSVVVVFSLAPENATFIATRRLILAASAFVTIGTAFLLLFITGRQVVVPLDRLVRAARRIEMGDRNVHVEVASGDELGRLASVFNSMTAAIHEREVRLEEATRSLRELFDHMSQAIVVFGPNGVVEGESSHMANVIFGEGVVGRNAKDLLYPGKAGLGVEAQAFEEWVTLLFARPSAWAELETLAPREVTLMHDGEPARHLQLEFRPIVFEGVVARVMLLANDVTEKRLLERTVRTKEEEHTRQMAVMRRLVAGGAQLFVTFLAGSLERISRCEEILRTSGERLRAGEADELLQHVHTIKGEARAFDLTSVDAECAATEEELALLQARARSEGGVAIDRERQDWLARFQHARAAIADAKRLFVEASPIGSAILDQMTVRRSDVMRLSELASKRDRNDEIATIVNRLASRAFGEAVGTLVDKVPSWAELLGRRAAVEVEGREVLVPPELSRVLPPVLTHLLRNSVAHGIETEDEREKLGKPRIGLIRVICHEGPNGPEITVEDDGSGLDEDALEARAAALGLQGSAKDVAFAPGVSTVAEVTDLAGRGVGLSAVRAELANAGYGVSVETTRGRGFRVLLRPLGAR